MWAWYALYMGSSFCVEIFMPKRFANGLTGKATKKWIKKQYARHLVRYYAWLGVFWAIWRPNMLGHTTPIWGVFWLVSCLFIVDDYIFGDDDTWTKLRKWSGNRIKWKMDLPEPVTNDIGSVTCHRFVIGVVLPPTYSQ